MAAETPTVKPTRQRPRATTVFVAAFVAGAVAAVGVNRVLEVHLAQAKPQVECEPIFVALRTLPPGVPVTVWDVALRDWPKAMLPASALRVTDSFEGSVLKFPLREGQPLLRGQLLPPETPPAPAETPAAAERQLVEEAFVPPPPAPPLAASPPRTDTDEGSPRPTATDVAVDVPAEDVPPEEETRDPASAPLPVPAAVAITTDPVTTDDPAPPTDTASPETAAIATPPADVDPPAVAEPVATNGADSDVPAVTGQPTPALTAAGPEQPWAAAPPIAVAPQPTDAADWSTDTQADHDLPPPAADLSGIPSVMTQDATAAPAVDAAGTGGHVRYLVVPERIARQADTSFTAPTAPEAGETRTASREPTAPAPQARASGQGQPSTQLPAAGRPPRQAGQRPTPSGKSPPPAAPRTTTDRSPPEARTWGGMFPNVAAGIDGWRNRSREAAAPRTTAPAPPQRR